MPLLLHQQGLVKLLSSRLCLDIKDLKPRKFMKSWKNMATRVENLRKVPLIMPSANDFVFTSLFCFEQTVKIALVGKYTKLEDAYASVIKALSHAALAVNRKLELTYIAAADLEDGTKKTSPVLFHEAWKKLCECDGSTKTFFTLAVHSTRLIVLQ